MMKRPTVSRQIPKLMKAGKKGQIDMKAKMIV